jgi:hypothetical protein
MDCQNDIVRRKVIAPRGPVCWRMLTTVCISDDLVKALPRA